RKTRVRKPSHLGSYSQPSPLGIPESEIAESIGSMSSGSGNFKLVPSCLYLVDSPAGWYYIVGRSNRPLNLDITPPPQPGKLAQAGFPSFWPYARAVPPTRRLRRRPPQQVGGELPFFWLEPLQKVSDRDRAVFLGQDFPGCGPDAARGHGTPGFEISK